MASFLEDLLKKMQNAPHVGIPPVTNPKVPTKVERDTAAYAARQKPMPNFLFGTGTPLEKLKARMANAPHPTPTMADPAFKTGDSEEEYDKLFDDLIEAIRVKNKLAQNTLKEGV